MNKFISLYFVYGLALFGMFFGAGNLAFPLKIGQITGVHWLSGAVGLAITGIILPFLGLFVVKLYRGDYLKFFGGAGSLVKSCFPLFALSLIGSFGGIPRCITIAYGGISYALPEFPLWAFSILFCAIVFFVGLRENRLISVVGKWLTPLLFIFLVMLILAGMAHTGCANGATGPSTVKSFSEGLIIGYQTMDLLAAFFFSALVFSQIKQTLPTHISDRGAVKIAIKAGVLASLLLMLVYFGLIFLGSHFQELIGQVSPSSMLIVIAAHTMGKYAGLSIGVTVMLACFTTVVALNSIYAKYLQSLFGLADGKFKFVLAGTTAVSFFVSLFDFSGISKFLAPVLEVSYPSIIALTAISIFSKEQYSLKKVAFYGILAAVLLSKI